MTSVAKLVASISRSPSGWLFEGVARPSAVIWLPALIIAALLLTAPVYLALRTLGAGSEAIDLIFRARTVEVIARTVALMAAVMLGCIAIAAPLAWLTVRTDLPARGFWRVVTMLPLALPSYIVGFAIAVGLGPRGILQGWLESAFGPFSITIDRIPSIYGFPGAAFTLIIISFPYVLLPIRTALWNMDTSLEESARALGRNRWETFRSVTLPMLRPAILAGGLLTALYALSDFGAVAIMRYETFTWSIFIQYGAALNRTLAAAWSLGLIVLALAVVWGEHTARTGFRNRGGGRYYLSGGGVARRPEAIPLGRWRWPALAYCGLVSLVSLGLPVAVLIYWTIRGVAAGEPLELLWRAAANSVGVSALAAILTVLCATPIAVLAVRYPGQFSRWLERLGFIGFALPGIVIALGLVYFGANYAPWLYQSLAMLAVAYVTLFLPAAVGSLRASLVQVRPEFEDAARSLGKKPLIVLLTITLPLIRPGILTGAALVFLLTMKELPATLILSPIGFTTLASSIWAAAEEAFFARAAAPALLLVVVSSVPLALITMREERHLK
ncbi:MAG: iron ABC transporter permease [Chloroflexi bacterium]|nr:iron ABC transporter permease [Chloroflexota bacterium]